MLFPCFILSSLVVGLCLLLQMQADILQVPVSRPKHMETTSLGAAVAAGIGVGFWTADQVFNELRGPSDGQTFKPQVETVDCDCAEHKPLSRHQQRSCIHVYLPHLG